MKQSIQERMDTQIGLTTLYNTLFDLIVTTTETSFETLSTNPADNMYVVSTDSLRIDVICNDNQYNTITVNIINKLDSNETNIGTIQVNINGDVDESTHNIPRAVRRTINDYIEAIYEVIDEWINEHTGNTSE
jgi:hypothetical protein